MGKNQVIKWSYLGILSVIWGSSYFLIKKGLISSDGVERMTSNQLGALRISFASLALLPLALKTFKVLDKKNIWFILIAGIAGNGLPAFLFAYAETKLSSSITGMLNSMVPIYTIAIAATFFAFKIKKNHVLGILIGIIGAALIVFEGLVGSEFSADQIIPFIIVNLATICYGLSLTVIKYKLVDMKPGAITSLSFFFIGVPSIVYLLSTGFFADLSANSEKLNGVGAVAILGLVGTALAVFMFNRLIKISSPLFASSVTYLIPIVATALGVIDGEHVTSLQIGGMIVLLLGVGIINRK